MPGASTWVCTDYSIWDVKVAFLLLVFWKSFFFFSNGYDIYVEVMSPNDWVVRFQIIKLCVTCLQRQPELMGMYWCKFNPESTSFWLPTWFGFLFLSDRKSFQIVDESSVQISMADSDKTFILSELYLYERIANLFQYDESRSKWKITIYDQKRFPFLIFLFVNLTQSAWYLHYLILDYTPLQLFQEVWETRPVSETPNVFDASPLWVFSQITSSGQR